MLALRVSDLAPRFLDFYDAALGAGAERRWQLWQDLYRFAPVPPTPEGQHLARQMLEAAWPRYPEVMDRIRGGASGVEPAPGPVLQSVAACLGYDGDGTVELTVFVGMLDGGAFCFGRAGTPVVCIPVEQEAAGRARMLPHELTHAVHMLAAGRTGGWERSVGDLVLAEGLATRVTAALLPGRPEADYVGSMAEPDWFARCQAQEAEILRGVRERVAQADAAAVKAFTLGPGPAGLRREAYYAGWVLVGHLLAAGRTLAELAHAPGESAPALVAAAIDSYLA